MKKDTKFKDDAGFQKRLFDKINDAFGDDDQKDEVLKFKRGGSVRSHETDIRDYKKGGDCHKGKK